MGAAGTHQRSLWRVQDHAKEYYVDEAAGRLFSVVLVMLVIAAIYGMTSQESAGRAQDDGTLAELECPTCHHDGLVFRVRVGQRLVSGMAGGLVFSRRARAQFECRHCHYFW